MQEIQSMSHEFELTDRNLAMTVKYPHITLISLILEKVHPSATKIHQGYKKRKTNIITDKSKVLISQSQIISLDGEPM